MRTAAEDLAAGSPSALAAAAGLMYPFTSSEGYLLAYGSHADGLARSRSDLDILIVSRTPWLPAQLAELRATVIELHQAHGLDLDTEVSYEVKLTASHAEIRAATHLEGFPVARSGKTQATRVTDYPIYLNSHLFKLRLLVNALSSPHVFLGGDLHRYEQHTAAATTAIAASLSIRWPSGRRAPFLGDYPHLADRQRAVGHSRFVRLWRRSCSGHMVNRVRTISATPSRHRSCPPSPVACISSASSASPTPSTAPPGPPTPPTAVPKRC